MRKQTSDNATPTDQTRRSFLTTLWVIFGLAALVECVGVAFAFLRSRKSAGKAKNGQIILTAGTVESFPPSSVTAFVRGRFYLSRLEDGGFLALSSKCTHLGCTVPWLEKQKEFVCPCHASAFDIAGNAIRPPASRPLDIYPITIENNVVRVDVRKPFKRNVFQAEQVAYPKKRGG